MCLSEDSRKVTALVLHRMKNSSSSTSLDGGMCHFREGGKGA